MGTGQQWQVTMMWSEDDNDNTKWGQQWQHDGDGSGNCGNDTSVMMQWHHIKETTVTQQKHCSGNNDYAAGTAMMQQGQQWCNGDSDVNRMVTVVTTMMLRPTPHQQPQWQWQNFNNRHKSKDNNNNKGNDKTNNDVKMTTMTTKQHKCNRQQPQQSCQQWCNKCHKTAVPIRHQWWWQKWHNNVMANNNGMRSNNNDTMPT